MGPLGAQELFLIFVLALLLFGPKKLPELGRMLGKGLTEFRRAKNELKSTFESHMHELEREVKISEKHDTYQWDKSADSTSYHSSSHPYSYDEYGNHQSAAEEAPPALPAPADAESVAQTEPAAGTVPRSHARPAAEEQALPLEEKHPA